MGDDKDAVKDSHSRLCMDLMSQSRPQTNILPVNPTATVAVIETFQFSRLTELHHLQS